MKKKIVALLMCVALLATAVVFAACGTTSLVDTSGKYEASTKEEAKALLNGKAIQSSTTYEALFNMSIDTEISGQKVSSKMNYSALMSYDVDGKYTMSGNMSMSASGGGQQQNINTSFYMDTEALYMTMQGQKVKLPISASGDFIQTEMLPTGDLSTMLEELPADTTIEVATSGDITKVKATYNIEGQGSGELYIVLDNGEFAGIKMTGFTTAMGMNITVEVVPTSKTITVPTDLDSYTPMA